MRSALPSRECALATLHGASGIEALWIENLSHEQPSASEILELADRVNALRPSTPAPTACDFLI